MKKKKVIAVFASAVMVFLLAVPLFLFSACSADDVNDGMPMVATGFAHTMVLRQDGTVWTWGRNEEGQLGNGNRLSQFSPVRFRIEPFTHGGVTFQPPERITKIASHKIHSMALGCDGSVWAGGWNEEGQLGANVGCRLTPIRVPFPDPDTNIIDIDAGMLFSIALRDNGFVYGWGRNRHALMGFTDINHLSRATRIEGLELHSITQIAAGHEHVLALRADGAVIAWGRNRNGQVGNFRYPDGHDMEGRLTGDVGLPTVIPFPGNPRIVEVRAGGFHSLARCENGFVYAWGRSDRGQIGDNASHVSSSQPIPQRVNIENVASITGSSGDSNAAILTDGSVRVWGRNHEGQLGDGTTTDRLEPVETLRSHGMPLRNIISISVGETHMSAICGQSGDVLSWGTAWCGEVGSGSVLTSERPVQVRSGIRCTETMHVPAPIVDSTPLTGITRLATGHLFTLALGHNGIVHGWGRNNHGQLIMQHSIDHRVATPLEDFRVTDRMNRFIGIRTAWDRNMGQTQGAENYAMLDGVTAISAGVEVGHAFGLAIRNGYAYGWGDNMNGWLGHGNIPNSRRTLGEEPKDNNPRRMLTAAGLPIAARDVAAGGRHSLILTEEGVVFAAGYGRHGRLGHGMTLAGGVQDVAIQYTPVPVRFPENTEIVYIEASLASSFAIDSNGYLWAWGRNNSGQLGTNDTNSRYVPVRVLGPTIRASGEKVTSVSAASDHTLALTSAGRVFSWGQGGNGRLGHGNTNQLLVPTHINAMPLAGGVVAIAAGGSHSAVIRSGDGTVWTWGNNNRSQLGRSSTWQDQQTPRQVTGGLVNATQIAAGNEHTVVIVGEGSSSTVFSWGSNNAGALGNGGRQAYRPRDDQNQTGGDEVVVTPHREPFAVRATGVHANFHFFNANRADFPPVAATANGGGRRSIHPAIIVLIVFLIIVLLLFAVPLIIVAIRKKPLKIGLITFYPPNARAKKEANTTESTSKSTPSSKKQTSRLKSNNKPKKGK